MIVCQNCGKELEDGTKFCAGCGTPVPQPESAPQAQPAAFCPNCGAQIAPGLAFCGNCGTALTAKAEAPAPVEVPAPVTPAPEKEKKPASGKKFPVKYLIIGAAAVAVIALVILLVSLIPASSGNASDFAMYIKENELVYSDLSDDGAFEVSSRLVSDSDSDPITDGYTVSSAIIVTQDGKRIFYPDRINTAESGSSIYCRPTNDPDADAIKLDSNIQQYSVNKNGSQVLYLKYNGDSQTLYSHNLEEKEKLANNVSSYFHTADFKTVAYLTYDMSLYLLDGEDKVKIASNIYDICDVNDDLSVFYYLKNDTLYRHEIKNDEKVKIDSGVSRVIRIYDTGEIYYTKAEEVEMKLIDFVHDDMKENDAILAEPVFPDYMPPDYPSWRDFDDDKAYEAAVKEYEEAFAAYETEWNLLVEEYYAAYDEYWLKQDRDALRESLADSVYTSTVYSLYYYDGASSTEVTDSLVNEWDVDTTATTATSLIYVSGQQHPTVPISEIYSEYDLSYMIEDAMRASGEAKILNVTTLNDVDLEEAFYVTMNNDGTGLYYMVDANENNEADLMYMPIDGGNAGAAETCDTDVCTSHFYVNGKNQPVYFKNVRDYESKGDLFVGGVEIDYDVNFYNVSFLDDAVVYFSDWNDERANGTLKIYRKDEAATIADDVHSFIFLDDDILYLYDYSTRYCAGSLYLFDGRESELLDEDVSAIVPVYSSSSAYINLYYW